MGINYKSLTKKHGSPLYIYDADIIRARCRALAKAFPDFRLFYACKANTNPEVVRIISKENFGIETVSPGEIAVARKVDVPVSDITFTCGNITETELVSVAKRNIRTHLDSLRQVEIFGKRFPGRDISVRLNLGIGAGDHTHVITGGPDSKFGIDLALLDPLKALAKKYDLKINGLHQHIGSNILEVPMFLKAMDVLFKAAMQFKEIEHLDFGGGFGVPYRTEQKPLNLQLLGKKVSERLRRFANAYGSIPEVSFEPGRYLVAEAGTLITTVVDIKRNPKKTFIGVDSGMGHLIRPAMYDSYHYIENVSRPKSRKQSVTIAGNYCESGDVLAKDRMIPIPQLGDLLAIRNAGAYGYTMSSDYNLRPRPKEIVVNS